MGWRAGVAVVVVVGNSGIPTSCDLIRSFSQSLVCPAAAAAAAAASGDGELGPLWTCSSAARGGWLAGGLAAIGCDWLALLLHLVAD